MPRLRKSFFNRSVHEVAPELIGATLLFRGAAGIYNIAEDDGAVAITKARIELGFDPAVRLEA